MSGRCVRSAWDVVPAITVHEHGAEAWRVHPAVVALVHLALADTYRDERGFTDETRDQLARQCGVSAHAVKRALGVLDALELWVMDSGGNQHRGARRVPTFLSTERAWHHADPSPNGGRSAHGAVPNEDGARMAPGNYGQPIRLPEPSRAVPNALHAERVLGAMPGARNAVPGAMPGAPTRPTPHTPYIPIPQSRTSRAETAAPATSPDGREGAPTDQPTGAAAWNGEPLPLGMLSLDVARYPHAAQVGWALAHAVRMVEDHRATVMGAPRMPQQAHAAVVDAVERNRATVDAWLTDGMRAYDAARKIAGRVDPRP